MYVIAIYGGSMNGTELARTEPAGLETLDAQETALTQMTLDGLASHTRTAYKRALRDFWTWHRQMGRPAFRKATIQAYAAELTASGLKAGNVNVRLAAIRKMLREAAANGIISEQDARSGQAVKGVSAPGRSVGVWLTKNQAESFLNGIPRATLAGKRDFALVALFLSSGLRRSEMASLTVEHIKQIEGRWAILGITGKRNKTRDVPIAPWAKYAVDEWLTAAGIQSGIIFRPVNKGDRLAGESMTPEAIRHTIDRAIGQANQNGAGLPAIAAHDLRRTFAQLARKGGAKLEQVSLALGHESIKTTEIYLGKKQDFTNAPCDSLGLIVEVVAQIL